MIEFGLAPWAFVMLFIALPLGIIYTYLELSGKADKIAESYTDREKIPSQQGETPRRD